MSDTNHDVYARSGDGAEWTWIATFASKKLADNYTTSAAIPAAAQTKVTPA